MSLLEEDTYKRPDAKILPLITPASARAEFSDGKMPLHFAAQYSSSEAVVQALLAAYAKAVKTTTKGGHTPLHFAAQYSSSVWVVQLLLAAYPEAAKATTKYGNTPASKAAKHNMNAAVKAFFASGEHLDPKWAAQATAAAAKAAAAKAAADKAQATAAAKAAADKAAWAKAAAAAPPGLKLEGGSLPGEAAKYPGTYRLVVGKLVNGRPAYQHTSDATRWIAFAGDRWMGQPESLLGQKLGFLDLQDAVAASPDVSAKTWQVNAGGTAAWVEQPQLKCTAKYLGSFQIKHQGSFQIKHHKAAADKVAADKAAAAKAQQEAEDAQLAAAIAASLAISDPVTPPPPPQTLAKSLATSRFIESYRKPERSPDQLYALMTTERH